jgi:abortive infection bacteriophage resistance protein
MNSKPPYDKPYKSFTDIVSHLEKKGLVISDRDTAETTLKYINYYRFKIYLRPLLNISTGQFKTGASFEEAYQLYRFDDELRDILFSIIGRIEVKIRTRLDQTIAEHTSNPFWYLDSHNFTSNVDDIRPSLNNKFTSSKDDFVKHYKDNYQAPNSVSVFHQNMPPFWVMAELTTFGNIVSLFWSLNKDKFPAGKYTNKLDILSQEFGAPSLDIFNSWLESLRETRNRCAHHSRVWNRNCFEAKGIQSKKSKFNLNLPPDGTVTPTSGRRNRFYSAMFVVFQVSKNLNIDRNIKDNFLELLEKYPKVKPHLDSAGFPDDWDSLKAWNI